MRRLATRIPARMQYRFRVSLSSSRFLRRACSNELSMQPLCDRFQCAMAMFRTIANVDHRVADVDSSTKLQVAVSS